MNTNVLFSFFKADSTTKKILLSKTCDWHAPSFSLEELDKYKLLIQKKNGLTQTDFEKQVRGLQKIVFFTNTQEYMDEDIECPDKDDIDFLALAHKLNCPLWSNDKKLKEQTIVCVLSTQEVITALFP